MHFFCFKYSRPKRALNHHYRLKTEFDLFRDQKNQQLLCMSIIFAVYTAILLLLNKSHIMLKVAEICSHYYTINKMHKTIVCIMFYTRKCGPECVTELQ